MEEDLDMFLDDIPSLHLPGSSTAITSDIELLLENVAVEGQAKSKTYKYYTIEVSDTSRVLVIK